MTLTPASARPAMCQPLRGLAYAGANDGESRQVDRLPERAREVALDEKQREGNDSIRTIDGPIDTSFENLTSAPQIPPRAASSLPCGHQGARRLRGAGSTG